MKGKPKAASTTGRKKASRKPRIVTPEQIEKEGIHRVGNMGAVSELSKFFNPEDPSSTSFCEELAKILTMGARAAGVPEDMINPLSYDKRRVIPDFLGNAKSINTGDPKSMADFMRGSREAVKELGIS